MGTGRRRPRKPGRGRKERRTQTEQGSRRVGWRNSRGSAAARPTLTRDWGGPQVRGQKPDESEVGLLEESTDVGEESTQSELEGANQETEAMHIKKLVVLRMNREFMKFMRREYTLNLHQFEKFGSVARARDQKEDDPVVMPAVDVMCA